MSTFDQAQFTRTVADDFNTRQRARSYAMFSNGNAMAAYRSLEKSLGHPDVQSLGLGERQTLPMSIVFLDLTDFTGRTFWDDQDDVVDLAHAVLSGFIETVTQFGGHALGLRGDGLFAGFGGPPELSAALALGACAFALDAVENGVNPWLDSKGMEHVQARAGADAGPITFIRTGSEAHSEINALGFAANFAAKCEKVADSWEVVVGQGLRRALPTNLEFSTHPKSPKEYRRRERREYYHFYDFRWRRALAHLGKVPEELGGVPSSNVLGRKS